jgi:tetratricopeptide (TPR) repeat protein
VQIPFDPGGKGRGALQLLRQANGIARSSAHGRYYASLIRLREISFGELWSAEAWVETGKHHLFAGDLHPAVAAFAQAMLIGTPDRDVFYFLGATWYELGEFQRAEQVLSGLVEDRPDHARGHYMLALVYRALDRWDDEGEALKRAVEADPCHADASYRLGNWYGFAGDPEASIVAYRKALEADPGHEAALFNLGGLLNRLGRVEEAKAVRDSLQPINEYLAEMLTMSIGQVTTPIPSMRRRCTSKGRES